ncbi:TetR/AcrR family transcriptional regulator [Sciscionella sediminilitoris]|uniref:TetR/AcrR family transcriptional regulator n=1 Tax=Sciscionella sediminilitoris TaxID=1445613 RepID=UPI0004DED35D|nr:TetR/AcrR family transcriptional regulator [Sciscionella sp. SE31]
MTEVKPQRLDYVEQTRTSVLEAAERLFIEDGYRRTSLDAVGAAARFTKGAVYRHFKDKQTLFEAVFERVETETMAALLAETKRGGDLWGSAIGAMAGYLEACTASRYRRIVLEEGPTVLGWARWRELDRRFTEALLDRLLEDLMNEGHIPRYPVDLLARLCCALIGEAGLAIAATEDPGQAREQTLDILTRLLSGLRLN